MRTVRSYISEIRNSISEDYRNIDDRLILTLIDQYRAIQIKNELNKDKIIPERIKQTLSGMQMNLSKQSILPFITDKSRILKSNVQIPDIITISNRPLLLNVYSDKILGKSFNVVSRDESVYSGNGKYNTKDVYCFVFNNFLYIKLNKNNPNLNLIDFITIEAIYEHPTEIIKLQYPTVDLYEFIYPINEIMWGYIKSSILQNSKLIIQEEKVDDKG
jgi:hypothetical protein